MLDALICPQFHERLAECTPGTSILCIKYPCCLDFCNCSAWQITYKVSHPIISKLYTHSEISTFAVLLKGMEARNRDKGRRIGV